MDRKDIPPRFVSRCELPSTSANKVSHSREKLGAHLKARIPTHVMTFCIPDGVIADNSVAGPFNQVDEDRIYLYQRKEWFANVDGFKQLIDKKDLRTVHIPGMGVQLSAWTGYSWSHFALDSLIRLGFVLERLQSTDPLWGKAKIVLNMHPEKGMDSTYEDMDHMVQWVLEELGLKDRALPNNGWLVKAKSTFRFDYLVFVDVDPHFRCGPNQFVKENVFPRGSLLPVQKALGVLGAKRDLIVWAGREGRRAVDPDHKKKLQEGIMKLVHEHGLKLAFHEFHYDNNPWEVRDVYRRAAIVLGPHGGQLWNMALAAPGALVIEFATWNDTFHEQDCRTSGYSLANAAGHEYWVVDTENFGHFEGHELLPNIADVLRIVDGFLETHDDAD